MMPQRRQIYYLLGLVATGAALALGGRLAFPAAASVVIAAGVVLLSLRASRRWIGTAGTIAVFASLWLIGFALWRIFGGWFLPLILPPLFLGSFSVGSLAFGYRRVGFVLSAAFLFASVAAIDSVVVWPALILSVAAASVGWLVVSYFRPIMRTPVQLGEAALVVLAYVIASTSALTSALVAGALAVLLAVLYLYRFAAFDDIIVLVDERGVPVATERKLDAHHSDTQLHLAFSVFLFNSSGELLLQKRALTKKTWPGVWSNSCCGHQMLHESPAAAAMRRIRHELGLRRVKLYPVMPNFRYRAEKDGIVENEICPVFVGFTDKPIKPNPNEVDATRWVDWHSFVAEVDSPELGISPWAVQEVRLLASNDVFRRLFEENTHARRSAISPVPEPRTMC